MLDDFQAAGHLVHVFGALRGVRPHTFHDEVGEVFGHGAVDAVRRGDGFVEQEAVVGLLEREERGDSPADQSCATTIARLHRQQPFDFGITLGDNYQDDGPHGPADARWQTYWERFYPQLGIPFYVSLGNHDWNNPAGPAAGLLYQNPSWKLPALYYTYTAGPVQFFVLNTVLLSERQRLWLERELQASTARWKVVYGHYQIYSALRGDHATLVEDILPILEANDADLYLCGHEHLFQHIKPKGRVHLFVNGAAGAGARAAEKKNYANVLFMAERRQGFSILEASEGSLSVKFIDEKGAEIYHHTLRK